jgi:hypothetical protein
MPEGATPWRLVLRRRVLHNLSYTARSVWWLAPSLQASFRPAFRAFVLHEAEGAIGGIRARAAGSQRARPPC